MSSENLAAALEWAQTKTQMVRKSRGPAAAQAGATGESKYTNKNTLDKTKLPPVITAQVLQFETYVTNTHAVLYLLVRSRNLVSRLGPTPSASSYLTHTAAIK